MQDTSGGSIMSTNQHNTGDQHDTSETEPRLPEPQTLTFSMPILFDGFFYVENESDSGIAA